MYFFIDRSSHCESQLKRFQIARCGKEDVGAPFSNACQPWSGKVTCPRSHSYGVRDAPGLLCPAASYELKVFEMTYFNP